MSNSSYVPQRGDVVMFNFNPQMGHEQAGYRPALVLSPREYNGKTNLAVVHAITNQMKGYPFEEPIPIGHPVTGVILCDQIRTIDWSARQVRYLCILPAELVESAYARFASLMPSIDNSSIDFDDSDTE